MDLGLPQRLGFGGLAIGLGLEAFEQLMISSSILLSGHAMEKLVASNSNGRRRFGFRPFFLGPWFFGRRTSFFHNF
jgi:hypothetical protein